MDDEIRALGQTLVTVLFVSFLVAAVVTLQNLIVERFDIVNGDNDVVTVAPEPAPEPATSPTEPQVVYIEKEVPVVIEKEVPVVVEKEVQVSSSDDKYPWAKEVVAGIIGTIITTVATFIWSKVRKRKSQREKEEKPNITVNV